MKKRWINAAVALCSLVLAACASSAFFPLPTGQVSVEETFAIIRTDSVMIVVRPESALLDSRTISQNYFSMYVQIKNLSQNTLPFKNMPVAVVAQGMQFDPLSLDYLLQLLRLEMTMTQTGDPFNVQPTAVSLEDRQDAYVSLMSNYLVLTDIIPGSSIEGYLYFSNSLKGAADFTLHMGKWTVMYERRQKK